MPIIDEIGQFWVVMLPTAKSELSDILFETNIFRIMLQTQGGLKAEDIVGLFRSQDDARACACKLLLLAQQSGASL